MAALTAPFQGWRVCQGTGELKIEVGSQGTLTFYRGSLVCYDVTGATRKLLKSNATADEFAGIVEKQGAYTVDQPVPIWVRGVMYFTGVANFTYANQGVPMYLVAGEDNPANLTATITAQPGAVGRLLGVEVTAVSGFLDISDRSIVSNG